VSSRREKQKQEKKKGLPVGEKAKLKKRRIFGFGLQLAFRFKNSVQEKRLSAKN